MYVYQERSEHCLKAAEITHIYHIQTPYAAVTQRWRRYSYLTKVQQLLCHSYTYMGDTQVRGHRYTQIQCIQLSYRYTPDTQPDTQ